MMVNMDSDIGQNDATKIFLCFPTPTTQKRKVSTMITVTGGSRWSRSCTNGASNFIMVASTKELMLMTRPSSDGIMLGMVPKQMLSGLGLEPMKPSHSSVTMKVTRILLFFEVSVLQKFIMGLIWPWPGQGMATTWHCVVGLALTKLILQRR